MHLAIPQVSNLMAMGGRQSMNDSFGSFKILNTYGAFGQRGWHTEPEGSVWV